MELAGQLNMFGEETAEDAEYVLTAAAAYQYSRLGVEYRLEKADCTPISAMDAQRNVGKAIFGSGFLLSDRAAADRAAADRAAADRANVTTWKLSDRERAIVDTLGGGNTGVMQHCE